ncbi:MAG: hypothetical protein LBT17_00960 [Mycoplasmataceae bacterium]|jgi:hypothetical protein|nr:hypothetical protein [Mycoplasmataceae bacterium]
MNAIVKKSGQYLTFISKSFKSMASGKSVVVTASFHFPKEFVKAAANGKSKYISIKASTLANSIFVAPDKKSKK